jgi:transmembrane secretion effector
VTDPATALAGELVDDRRAPAGTRALLGQPDFRRVYAAGCVSELGDAFQYIALMWVALVLGGPLGVLAVRLADSLPALVFGFHGGLVADRWDRPRTMVSADFARAAVLGPVALAALSGHLPLWALVVAAFLLTTATSYFEPAYGALLPALVERRNVQAANGLVQATNAMLSVAGWALAAALLALVPIGAFFAVNAVSYVASALLLIGVRARSGRRENAAPPQIREGFAALRPIPALATAVAAVGICVTITSGTWIVGVPTLVRDTLDSGAGSFSLIAAAYALGVAAAGVALTRHPVRRKAAASLAAWTLYLPAYGLFAVAHSLAVALAAGALAGIAQSSAMVLVFAAAQESVPDAVLGRVVGLISLVRTGAHATGLLLLSPFFAVLAPGTVFAAAGAAIALAGLGGLAFATRPLR